MRAECLMSNWLVQHNIPFKAMEHLQKVMKSAFDDSAIIKAYACSRTKSTHVAGAMAAYLK